MDDNGGVSYILASSIENKDNEITLKNEAPKSEYSFKNGENPSESTLRNEAPKSGKNPRSAPEFEPRMKAEPTPKREPEEVKAKMAKPEDHVKTGEDGKPIWDKTHFILAIEAGGKI